MLSGSMRGAFLLTLFIWSFHRTKSEEPESRLKRQSSCDGPRPQTSISASLECCDPALGRILQNLTNSAPDDIKLGNLARRIQRQIQRRFDSSYEVIISEQNFALASHYSGTHTCKIRSNSYVLLAYRTPIQYNIHNVPREKFFANVDAQEPNGADLTPNTRGEFLDIRQHPEAGGGRDVQPAIGEARARHFHRGVNRYHFHRSVYPRVSSEERGSGSVEDESLEFDEEVVSQESLKQSTNDTSQEIETVTREKQALPAGTQCGRQDPRGNKCCSGELHETMRDVIDEVATSPHFGEPKSYGVVATLIKHRAQRRFDQSYEVIVSGDDFVISSYSVGDGYCKFLHKGMTVLSYETPIQYDPSDEQKEAFFDSISNEEPFGSDADRLEGQISNIALALEPSGPRAGFPEGSHCGRSRYGSRCCSLPLFQSMHNAYNYMIENRLISKYDLRQMATVIRDAAEDYLQHSYEVFVSHDDFTFASRYHGDNSCKFRIDDFYILAYETPVPYPLHWNNFADFGEYSDVGCAAGLNGLEGSTCCNGALHYEIMKRINDWKSNPQYRQSNYDHVATVIANAVQERFNGSFETMISHADFTWKTHNYNGGKRACKIDAMGYHTLVFQSSLMYAGYPEFVDGSSFAGGNIIQAPVIQNQFALGQAPQLPFQAAQQAFAQQAFAQQPFAQQAFAQQAFAQQPFAQQPVVQQPLIQQPVIQQPAVGQQVPPVAPAQPPVQPFNAPYTPAFGFGAGAGACFSTDTWVTTPEGKKRMDDIKVGDYVLTANSTDTYYTSINYWIHRDPEIVGEFLTLMTEFGKMLRLTSKHLIFRNKCGLYYDDFITELPPNNDAVFADELKIGDCLIVMYKGKWRQQKLLRITKTQRQGVFAPMTANGRIIVNDIVASCFSEVNAPTVQNTYFETIAYARHWIEDLEKMITTTSVKLPLFTDLAKDLMQLVLS